MVAPSEILAQTGLQTEFYQLVQAALYHADGMWGDATVDLFVHSLPKIMDIWWPPGFSQPSMPS